MTSEKNPKFQFSISCRSSIKSRRSQTKFGSLKSNLIEDVEDSLDKFSPLLASGTPLLASVKRTPYTRKKFSGSLTPIEEALHQLHVLTEKLEKLSEAIDSLALEQRVLLERQVKAGIDVPLKFSKEALEPACYCHRVKRELVEIIKVGRSRLDKEKILERLHDLVNPKFESQGFNSTHSDPKKAKTNTSEEDTFHGIHTPANLNYSPIKESPFRIQNRFRSYSRGLPKPENFDLLKKSSAGPPKTFQQYTYQAWNKRAGIIKVVDASEVDAADEWEPGGLHLPERFSTAPHAASNKSRSNLQIGSTIQKLPTLQSGLEAIDSIKKRAQLNLAPTIFDNHLASNVSNLAVSGNNALESLLLPLNRRAPVYDNQQFELTDREAVPEPEPLHRGDSQAVVLNTSTDS